MSYTNAALQRAMIAEAARKELSTIKCTVEAKVYYTPTKNIVHPKIPLYFRFRKFCDRITMPWRLK